MGWDGYHDRRKWLAEQKTKTWSYGENTCSYRKHHASGQEDWFILDVKTPDGTLVESLIVVTLWDGGMKKDMSEDMGPYCYGCPIEWLDEVPAGEYRDGAYNWRKARRALEEDVEHDPNTCGCVYLGCDMWSCGHIDNEPDEEPEIDDSIKFCPDCETPNQFGEICAACERDRQEKIRENALPCNDAKPIAD